MKGAMMPLIPVSCPASLAFADFQSRKVPLTASNAASFRLEADMDAQPSLNDLLHRACGG